MGPSVSTTMNDEWPDIRLHHHAVPKEYRPCPECALDLILHLLGFLDGCGNRHNHCLPLRPAFKLHGRKINRENAILSVAIITVNRKIPCLILKFFLVDNSCLTILKESGHARPSRQRERGDYSWKSPIVCRPRISGEDKRYNCFEDSPRDSFSHYLHTRMAAAHPG